MLTCSRWSCTKIGNCKVGVFLSTYSPLNNAHAILYSESMLSTSEKYASVRGRYESTFIAVKPKELLITIDVGDIDFCLVICRSTLAFAPDDS